jgi:hypothetical protein
LISASTLLVCSCLRRRRVSARGEQLALGDELQRPLRLVPEEARRQRRGGDGHLLVAGQEVGQRLDGGTWILWSRSSSSRLAPAFALAHQQHAVGRAVQVLFQRRQRLVAPRLTLTSGSGRAQSTGSLPRTDSTACGCVARRTPPRSGRSRRAAGWAARGRAAGSGGARGVGPEALDGLVHLAVQHQAGLSPR